MEAWERASLLFDAETVTALKKKWALNGVEFFPLDRFIDLGDCEGQARHLETTDTNRLILRLRRKGEIDVDSFDRHAATFFLGEAFSAFPVIEVDGKQERAYSRDVAKDASATKSPSVSV